MLENAVFGIYRTFFEKVLTTVNLHPIYSTIPSIFLSGDLINSPTLKWSIKKIIIPPKNLKEDLLMPNLLLNHQQFQMLRGQIFNPNSCIINKIAITTTITLIILTTISYVSDTKAASSFQRYF